MRKFFLCNLQFSYFSDDGDSNYLQSNDDDAAKTVDCVNDD